MAHDFLLNIVSFEGKIFSGRVTFLKFKSLSGEMGVMAGHVPMLTALQPGSIVYHSVDGDDVVFISGGIIVINHEEVSILADHCYVAATLDEARIQEAKNKAEELMSQRKDTQSYYQAYAELNRSVLLLQSIQDLHKIRKRQ